MAEPDPLEELRRADIRLERIMAGDIGIPGSRERSLVGRLDRDHSRILKLEAAHAEMERLRLEDLKHRLEVMEELVKNMKKRFWQVFLAILGLGLVAIEEVIRRVISG